MKKRQLKVGVRQGAGSPPGYEWSVGILDIAFEEAMNVLGPSGYGHFALQVKELAFQEDPKHSDTIDVRPVEDVMEIRDHGGVLGNVNVRVFYGVDNGRRNLIVLSVIKKQNNGPTPLGDKVTIRRRWRKYLNGEFGYLE